MIRSLRQRLLVILGGSIIVAWLATALFSYLDTRQLIDEMLDTHLEQSADLLVVLLDRLPQGDLAKTLLHQTGADADRMIAFRVHAGAGGASADSVGSPTFPTESWQPGFHDATSADQVWRVFGTSDSAGRLVEVALRHDLKGKFADLVAVHILHPLWVAIPLLAGLIWLSVGWGLRPLRDITSAVERRSPDDMQPLGVGAAPNEIRPLLEALDRLFARIALLLDRERRFAADAAHELRTPLAAIKTHAQVARQERDPEKCAAALDGVIEGADRGTRLVEQLLVLSRVDQDGAAATKGPVNIADLVIECVAEAAPKAAAKNMDLGVADVSRDPAVVVGNADLLRILLRNLLDNAVRYTPAEGEVTVSVDVLDQSVILRVCDSGPGIPMGLRERVFDRFYRVAGSGQQGCGLGLSIVARIAGLHGGSVAFEDRAGKSGVTIMVTLPAA
ncbi:ATP-binding protein [Antarcticimicrobium luteum]|uniref:histidine kinase n=1 Tax=Antarcticimicrobium luteum TaxID=2547397 RepID=A0A4R5VCA5_9RHOB|nr:ATP-binding protein [Antarcticimicrobium luteum]TDK49704.1 two-component sensor histidine kinase [Antarcticimicrobium luteum]